MKWVGIYLTGFAILVGGILAALWKMDVLTKIGAGWTAIGVVIALGIGIMLAVSHSGKKESIAIERK